MDKLSSKLKSLNEFLDSNEFKEGLSFSDYFDDSIPYEVKPVPSLKPMQEDDYPIQAKDLFKGLWEDNEIPSKDKLFIEHMMPQDMDTFKAHLAELFAYLKQELQLKSTPKVKLTEDEKNASKVLGKTAYYDPSNQLIVLFVTNRHQKDILRSFSHEVIHHWQHENEKLQTPDKTNEGGRDPQYAQNNPWLRQMEKQAYLLGNILFRDWEDQKKAKDRKSGKKMAESKSDQADKIVAMAKMGHGRWIGSCGHVIKSCRCKHGSELEFKTLSPCPSCMKKSKITEKTYKIGTEYPPKKMDYSG